MKDKRKKGGRPKGPVTTAITFRADDTVLEAIEKLALALSDGKGMAPGSLRATAIRRAILNAAEGIDEDLDSINCVPLTEDSQHPACVLEGFVREDMAREYEALPPGKPFDVGTVFLRSGVKPVIGAYVKMQVSCKPTWNKDFKEHVSYALMGGRVHTVREDGHVLATVSVTNMPAPAELDVGDWDVELVFKVELEHPWVMVSMRRRRPN